MTRLPSNAAHSLRRGIFLLSIVLALAAVSTGVNQAKSWTNAILHLLDHLHSAGWIGCLIFLLLQTTVALIGILPASLLGIAAGAVYGIGAGFALAATGVLLGAAIAFALSRSVLRASVAPLFVSGGRLDQIDSAISADGWRLVLLLRASPVVPFSITSYALGLSSVTVRDYALGTLAALPALFLYVLLGTVGTVGLRALHDQESSLRLALICLAVVATALLSIRTGQLIALIARTDKRSNQPGKTGLRQPTEAAEPKLQPTSRRRSAVEQSPGTTAATLPAINKNLHVVFDCI